MPHSHRQQTVHHAPPLWKSALQTAMEPRMNGPSTNPSQAGGSILALSILAGAIGGIILGQPSIGFLVGLAAGTAIALILWRRDRRR